MNKQHTYTLCFLITLLFVTACGPVHRYTRVKKIPREHSFNYCGGEIKAPKSDINKNPWIVYSDREKNQTYNNAAGKVKAKDVGYLDPFLVIGKKGEYLKLIKYTPDILKNGKLEYKKAEYYGWMHKSKLLLNQQSVTEIASGKKQKMLAVFTDTISINEPQKYFVTDSIKLFKDLELVTQSATISPYSLIYQMKESADGSMLLASRKPYTNPDAIQEDILGWIDKSLVTSIGTGLHVDLGTIPSDSKQFLIKGDKKVELTEDILDVSHILREQYQTIKYSPVSSFSIKDTLFAFKTRIPLPVFDYSNNYVFNVNGKPISHKQFRDIAKGQRKINISFAFEGGEQTIARFPQIVNALQNLQPLFEESDNAYSYQFNTVMNFDETGKLLRPITTNLTNDYTQVVNYLTEKANVQNKLRPIILPRGSWTSLRKSADSFDKHRDATNLIVLIGDRRINGSGIDSTLVNKLLKNNCRLIGFQVYAENGDDYNNFVLDIEEAITSYATGMIKTKRELLVSPEQIKRDNYYTQVAGQDNNYRLDFPENSITQGGLFFPKKSENLQMEIITNNIDTIIQQIKQDNRIISQYMSKSFRSVGNNRTRFDSLFVQNYGIDTTHIPNKKLIAGFVQETPGWYIPSDIVLVNDWTNHRIDYRLLLSELEMKELKEFIASLSEKEVDYIYQDDEEGNKQREDKKRKPCNCEDDNLFIQMEKQEKEKEKQSTYHIGKDNDFFHEITRRGEYVNTRQVRKHLLKILLDPIKYCKLCKEKIADLKTMTLAQAHYRITGLPTSNPLLNSLHVQDLENKVIVPAETIEELVEYYKKMKKELEKAEKFESNGQTYYWVEKKHLP